MNEIEVRFLEIDVPSLEKKLHALGAEKLFDTMLEEWLFVKPEWKEQKGRLRIRKNNNTIQIAYKETTQDTSKGNIEIEFEIDTIENALYFVKQMGLRNPRHQQKRRVAYLLDDVHIDIDFWPKIPPYVEIEADSMEKVEKVAKELGFNIKDVCNLDAFQVIKDIYGIDLSHITEYVFS
jgi:adenylate cyclase class 2